jgi:hypothetical protein
MSWGRFQFPELKEKCVEPHRFEFQTARKLKFMLRRQPVEHRTFL